MRRISWLLSLAFVLVGSGPLAAQMRVQGGRALDANPRVGSGGRNRITSSYQNYGSSSRLIMTGNVTGGRSFRGYSPIGNPNQLFSIGRLRSSSLVEGDSGGLRTQVTAAGALPSDRLSNFRRDSYNVADYARPGVPYYEPRPYYSRSSTVTDIGAISRRLNEPGTSQLRSAYEMPESDYRVDLVNPLENLGSSVGRGMSAPSYVYAPPEEMGLRRSILMSSAPLVSERELAREAEGELRMGPGTNDTADQRIQPRPLDQRVNTEAGEKGPWRPKPLDQLLNPDTTESRVEPQEPGEQLLRPLRPREDEMQEPVEQPSGTEAPGMLMGQPGSGGVASDEPFKTFVADRRTEAGQRLREAEQYLAKGEYYRADDVYDLAYRLDTDNPLPLLGRSMALLAAGDYMSSSYHLLRAMKMVGPENGLAVDLKAFIPDLDVLDRRRADLEEQLETSENWRLRLLLGYAEYCSGLPEFGLKDLDKAASVAADESPENALAIRTLTDALKARQAESGDRP